jgi:hypothetical protein
METADLSADGHDSLPEVSSTVGRRSGVELIPRPAERVSSGIPKAVGV